jgi:hypothetical protein
MERQTLYNLQEKEYEVLIRFGVSDRVRVIEECVGMMQASIWQGSEFHCSARAVGMLETSH